MNKSNLFTSPLEISKQESLTIERLRKLSPNIISLKDNEDKYSSTLLKLINWAKNIYCTNESESTVYLHNNIVIDGKFLTFAEENKIKVESLYKDSIISYKEFDHDKFQVQGVFKISTTNLSFLLVSTFVTTSVEDELVYFTIVDNEQYESYQKFRQKYQDWYEVRDRLDSSITVIGGESLLFNRDSSWDELFLEEEQKKEIQNMIETFLNNKQFYLDNKIPWKKGLLLWGDPGNGKTSIIKTIISNYSFKPITIVPEADNDTIREAFNYAEENAPSLLYIEDLDSLFLNRSIDVSLFLNLMDGVVSKNGLFVIATANDISNFKDNITQRPSRFDRIIEIEHPTEKMCYEYLKKWFGSLLSNDKILSLSKKCFSYKLSYAYLKEIYILSMFEGISNNRKKPILKDIDISLNRLLKDKNINKQKKVNLDNYKSKV